MQGKNFWKGAPVLGFNLRFFLNSAVTLRVRALGAGLLWLACAAQAGPLSVKPLSYKGTMPYVQSDNAQLAQRINSLIYLDMLELSPPAKLQDGLKEKKVEEGMQPTSDLSFEVGRNDERILALSISAEGCGAYCEYYTRQFNFDANTGRHIVASDIFTSAGAVTLMKQLGTLRLARVKAEIARMRNDAKTHGAKTAVAKDKAQLKEDGAGFNEAIEMYEQCAASIVDPEMAKYRTIDTDKMKIGNNAITFIRERCSIHALRALDNLDEIAHTLSLKDLAPYLNDYGRSLLVSGGGNALPVGGPFNQVLIGKIGQAPITLRLGARNTDDTVSGTYYYNKYRTPIPLFGKVTGNTLAMEESESKDQTLPVIRATIKGESLKGLWVGSGKQIAFEAGP